MQAEGGEGGGLVDAMEMIWKTLASQPVKALMAQGGIFICVPHLSSFVCPIYLHCVSFICVPHLSSFVDGIRWDLHLCAPFIFIVYPSFVCHVLHLSSFIFICVPHLSSFIFFCVPHLSSFVYPSFVCPIYLLLCILHLWAPFIFICVYPSFVCPIYLHLCVSFICVPHLS